MAMNPGMKQKRRLHELGVVIGELTSGKENGITDVPHVRVGHVTVRDHDVNTGVTVVMPHELDAENALYFWGRYILNGSGEMTGIQVLEDFGLMSAPILLTNAMSVGKVYNGAITYGYTRGKGLPTNGGWPPVVIGFDDRYLNNLGKRVITEEHALQAIQGASSGRIAEGSVGAGTGATAFGFKGGIGTASRRATTDGSQYHVGVLTLANHGRREDFRVDGVPVGKELPGPVPAGNPFKSVSCIVATDAPLTARQMNSLAQQAGLGLAAVGSMDDPEESCMVISFSTGLQLRSRGQVGEYRLRFVADEHVSTLYRAAAEAAQESILNALLQATTLTGRDGHRSEALPVESIRQVLKTYRRIAP